MEAYNEAMASMLKKQLEAILPAEDPTPEPLSRDLFIKFLTGKTIALSVPCNSTVLRVKEQIYENNGTPVRLQRLLFAGKQLEEERKLEDYNVPSGATLHLVLRLLSCVSCSGECNDLRDANQA